MDKINLEDLKWHKGVTLIMNRVGHIESTKGIIELEHLKDVMTEIIEQCYMALISLDVLPEQLRNDSVRNIFVRDMCKKFIEERGIVLQEGEMLTTPENTPWVKDALTTGKIKFDSYTRYVDDVLRGRNLSNESIVNMDKVTSSILDGMGDPLRTGHTLGLLMGDVQAGKTLTFTGICHKAVDAGYRFIVVLTGTTNTLRVQTQNRLNADLIGQITQSNGQQTRIWDEKSVFNWNQLTTTAFDFTAAKADSQIAVDDPKLVTLAVIKKNATVLRHMLKWLENTKELGVQRLPLLLVDDEADNASVNSKKEDENPTKINELIRKILAFFDRTAYLAVTATPFANVFINPQIDKKTGKMILKEKETMDLFPRDYIYALPPPKGYLGVERLFGELGEYEEDSLKYGALIPMRLEDETDTASEIEARKIYEGKIKKPDDVKKLPTSLVTAVLYFCCICVLKDIQETTRVTNTSMLVHIARFTRVQNHLANLIEDLLAEVKDLAEVFGGRDCLELQEDHHYQILESLWNEGCGNELWYDDPTHGSRPKTCKELTGFDWHHVWQKRFGKVVSTIRVVLVNSEAKQKNMASYYEKNNARLITVGGDALSRGLTLEGLCVSYFSRRSPAYDTLLQMGRWFGYRESVRKFMKIWISDCIISSYEIIAEALGEFRSTLEDMRRKHRRPSDFGLRIRCAPANARMMITAANKRRSVKRIKAWINLAGQDFQAATFPADETERQKNVQTISSFLKELGPIRYGKDVFPGGTGGHDLVWVDVPATNVARLICNLNVPSWSKGLEPIQAAKRIEARNELWTVRVISLNNEDRTDNIEDVFGLGDLGKVVCSRRTMRKFPTWVQQTSKGIRSSSHFSRHWTREKIEEVQKTINGFSEKRKMIYPERVFAEPGETPQLLVYPIRPIPQSESQSKRLRGEPFDKDEVMATVAFGLPCDEKREEGDPICVQYDTNIVWQMLQDEGFDAEGEE